MSSQPSPSKSVSDVPHATRARHRLARSEEYTSELQSLRHLVCRLLLEKKKKSTVVEIRAAGAQAPAMAVDISSQSQRLRLVEAARAADARMHTLMNNTAITRY